MISSEVYCTATSARSSSNRKLQALASKYPPHELGDSVELRVCIQRAAMQLLCDLVRADEICASFIARCGYHGELGTQPDF